MNNVSPEVEWVANDRHPLRVRRTRLEWLLHREWAAWRAWTYSTLGMQNPPPAPVPPFTYTDYVTLQRCFELKQQAWDQWRALFADSARWG